jgi:hypothetical protein
MAERSQSGVPGGRTAAGQAGGKLIGVQPALNSLARNLR